MSPTRRGHLSLMRKANDFLQSGAPLTGLVRAHAARMEQWLGVLQAQIGASMPDRPKTDAPDIEETWLWVEALLEEALDQVDTDMITSGCISRETAWQNQKALIAALLSGVFLPPCRIHVLTTMSHPRFRGKVACQDPDCAMGSECAGNHLALTTVASKGSSWEHFDFDTTSVQSVVVHHKNDRRGGSQHLEYEFPDGALVKSLLVHINAGHTLLTDGRSAGGMTKLFVSHPGNAFSSTTFCHFWRSLMEQVTEQKYFAPSVLRTMFVEEYTAAHGAEPEMWDGCAAIMGNSVPQWRKHYNPSARRREAASAIRGHMAQREKRKLAIAGAIIL